MGAALTAASFLLCLQNPIVAPLLLLNLPIAVLAITIVLGLCMIKFGLNLLRAERQRAPGHDARLFGRRNNDIETGNSNRLGYSPR